MRCDSYTACRRAPLEEVDDEDNGDVQTFECSRLPMRRPAGRLAAVSRLSHRCVRILSSSPLEPSAAASNSTDSFNSSTYSTASESARVRRDWTQSSVYSDAGDRDILAVASRTPHPLSPQQTSPPDEISCIGNSGGVVGTDVVAKRLRGPPGGSCAPCGTPAHTFSRSARRTGLKAAQIRYMNFLITDAFAAADRLALVGLANSRALDLFQLESHSCAATSLPTAGTEPLRTQITPLCAPSARTCPLRTARNCSHSSAATTSRSACCSCANFSFSLIFSFIVS